MCQGCHTGRKSMGSSLVSTPEGPCGMRSQLHEAFGHWSLALTGRVPPLAATRRGGISDCMGHAGRC
jgi:hypothetical protein